MDLIKQNSSIHNFILLISRNDKPISTAHNQMALRLEGVSRSYINNQIIIDSGQNPRKFCTK